VTGDGGENVLPGGDTIRMAMRNNAGTKPLYGEIQNVGDEGGDFVFIKRH